MLIESISLAETTIRRLREDPRAIVMDVEATGKDWRHDWICSVQLKLRGAPETYYFPFRHGEGFNLPIDLLARIFAEALHPDRLQIGFNYGFDIKIGAKDGMRLPRRIMDPMLAAHQMNENEDSFKLKDLCRKYLGADSADAETALLDHIVSRFGGSHKTAKGDLWRLPARDVVRYGEDDIILTERLLDFYLPELEEWRVLDIFHEVCEFQLGLAEIELRGMPISLPALDKLEAEAAPKAAELRERIRVQACEDIGDPDFPANPNSHPQMGFWLKPILNVPDTSKDSLNLADDFRGKLLLDYRVWNKLVTSFVEPYREKHIDGRLHCNLYICTPGVRDRKDADGIHGTCSDRVSCTEPNLQQVPDVVRKAFEAPPGKEFVEFDYSQLELRLAAHYYETQCSDSTLADILRKGEDMHQATADSFGIGRKPAKVRNFAIQYGAGAAKLALKNGTNARDERAYLTHYHKMFPGCRRLQRMCTSAAERNEYIRLWTGRTRRFNTPRAASYKASNNLIQGGAAQILRRALVHVRRGVPEAEMVLTVHDSIVFLLPKGRRDLVQRIRAIMQDNPEFALPMIVDVKAGPTWGDTKELPRDMQGLSHAQLAAVFALAWVAPK